MKKYCTISWGVTWIAAAVGLGAIAVHSVNERTREARATRVITCRNLTEATDIANQSLLRGLNRAARLQKRGRDEKVRDVLDRVLSEFAILGGDLARSSCRGASTVLKEHYRSAYARAAEVWNPLPPTKDDLLAGAIYHLKRAAVEVREANDAFLRGAQRWPGTKKNGQ